MSAVEQLYTADIVEIVLDLPMPVSANRIWRRRKTVSAKGKANYRSPEYLNWCHQADVMMIAKRQYPKRKIHGPFTAEFAFNNSTRRGDLDNRAKVLFDYLQSRDLIRNDKDCEGYGCIWVKPELAPAGCRVTLRSLHEGAG